MAENEVVADEPGAAPAETVEEESAQTDETSLDELLDNFNSEFDEDTQPPESKDNLSDADVAEVKEFMTEYRQEQTNKAVSTAAKTVIQALGDEVNVTEDTVVDLLYGRASRDKRFLNAFIQRDAKPKEWHKVLAGVASKLKDDLGGQIDQTITNDREAVANAIRGKSTVTEDEPPNLNAMSDAEFNQWKREQRG